MPPGTYHLRTRVSDLAALGRLAERLAKRLKAGDVVAMEGPLGAGKTTLVQKIGEALGLKDRPVSPTFVLIHEYAGGMLPVVHADLYRLGAAQSESLADELLDTIQAGQAVLFVEWANFGDFLGPYVTLAIDIDMESGTEARVLTLRATRPDLVEGLDA